MHSIRDLTAGALLLFVIFQLSVAGAVPAAVAPQSTSDGGGPVAASLETANDTSTPGSSGNVTAIDLDESDQVTPDADPTRAQRNNIETTTFVVEAANESAIDTDRLGEHAVDVGARHDQYVEVTATGAGIEAIERIPWVVSTRTAVSPTASAYSEGVESVSAERLHDVGVTGEGTKVGVLTLGVDRYSSEYRDQVIEAKSFHSEGLTGGNSQHGTGVTEIVSDMAPDASLYLTSFGSGYGYADAVDWLLAQGVDVIVMSAGFPGQTDDGESWVSQVATDATAEGVIWANSAGNSGETHWQGTFSSSDSDSWHEFGAGTEGNALNDGQRLQAGTGVTLRLQWDDYPSTDDDYTLYLLDSNDDVVATSSRSYAGSTEPSETLSATLPETDRYYFALAGPDSEHAIEVTGSDSTRRFSHAVRAGSIRAPSVARGVTAVGAYNVENGGLEPYSSAGPTNDGRRGVDVLAPARVSTQAYDGSFAGTSAAAPHVGGAAALLHSINGSLSGAETERALMDSARDVSPAGLDPTTGAGEVNVTAAAERVDPSVNLSVAANESRITVGEPVEFTVTRTDTGEPVEAVLSARGDTARTEPDGTVVLSHSTATTYDLNATATADPPTADFEPASTEFTVHPEEAELKGPVVPGVDQNVSNAVAGADGDIGVGDIRAAVRAYVTDDGAFGDVTVTVSDIRAFVQYYITN